jgi:HK97 family phage prohead protease
MLLGRTSAGTLRLIEDEIGLRMELDLPDTTLGRDVAELTRSRNLQGQSFSFTTAVAQWDYSSDPAIRTVIEVDSLFDVGPVTFPAYEETSVAMRQFRSKSEPETPSMPAHALEHERDLARLRLSEV